MMRGRGDADRIVRRFCACVLAVAGLASLAAIANPDAAQSTAGRSRTETPPLYAPWTDSSGIVRWTAREAENDPDFARVANQARTGTDVERVAAWAELSRDPILEPYALLRYGKALAAAGDSAGADSALDAAGRMNSLWQAESRVAWARLAIARGQMWRTETEIAAVEGSGWIGWPLIGPPVPPASEVHFAFNDDIPPEDPVRKAFMRWHPKDRADLAACSAEAHAALGDTLGALLLCASAYGSGEALLHRLLPRVSRWERDTRPRSATLREAIRNARINTGLARPDEYPRPNEVFWAEKPMELPGNVRDEHDLARMLGLLDAEDRRYGGPDSRRLLGRARLLRRFGRIEEAERALDRAESLTVVSKRDVGDVCWQRGLAYEVSGRWRDAFEQYVKYAHSNTAWNYWGYLRAGLMAMMIGERDSALAYLRRDPSEAGVFWRAVILRGSDPARSDTLFRNLARTPGYSFYEVAARETLQTHGWPIVAIARPDPGAEDGLILGRRLRTLGEPAEASRVAERWMLGDGRLRSHAEGNRVPAQVLAAAELSFANGDLGQGAQQVSVYATPAGWDIVPWIYPPLVRAELDAHPGAAWDGLDRDVLQSIAWQELASILWWRVPDGRTEAIERSLRDVGTKGGSDSPHTSVDVRFGAFDLARKVRDFGGDLALGLAAYDVGLEVVKRWQLRTGDAPRRVGGEAMVCALIGDVSTHDWVMNVLAARRAYAELRPTTREP